MPFSKSVLLGLTTSELQSSSLEKDEGALSSVSFNQHQVPTFHDGRDSNTTIQYKKALYEALDGRKVEIQGLKENLAYYKQHARARCNHKTILHLWLLDEAYHMATHEVHLITLKPCLQRTSLQWIWNATTKLHQVLSKSSSSWFNEI